MGCATAATQDGFSRVGLTLLLPRIGTFASLHGSRGEIPGGKPTGEWFAQG
jgi:hypothetical protein